MTLNLEQSVVSPILIGRAPQLAALEHLLSQVGQGGGQVVLVAGEAGIGKSRLATEARRRAEEQSWQVMQGRCFEPDRLFPYAPLIDLLRTCLTRRPSAEVTTLLGPLATEVVKLLPELAPALAGLPPTARLDPEAEKRRLFDMLVHFFTQWPAPLLLIIEDLHWSDETSLDFLRYLARRLAAQPLLLLLTYRSDEVHQTLQHFLAALEREQRPLELALPRLTPPEVDALLRAIFALGRPVRSDFLEALCKLTDGNPFFIEEVLKALIASGDLFYSDGVWDRKPMSELRIPRSVQDAVQRRVEQLTQAARQTLTLAAIAGQHFDFAVLQTVTGHSESELLAQIKEWLAAQLVVEASADRFAFRHALTCQAICSQLLAREQKALHRQLAEALEQLYATPLENYAAELAYHFYEAGVWEKTLTYARRAGEQAQALNTPRAAVEQFTRALEAAHHLGQTAALPTLQRARGLAYDTVGDFALALGDLETVLQMARSAGNHPMEWQALLDLGQLWAARDYTQTGAYFQQALELARTLDDPEILAQSLNWMGNWHLNHADEPLRALRYHQEALAIFQGLHDQRGMAQTFDLLGMAAYIAGKLRDSARYLQQAVGLWESLDARQGLAASFSTLSFCGLQSDSEIMGPATLSITQCIAYSERSIQLARELGWRAGEALSLILSGYSLSSYGRYKEALEGVESGLAIAQEIGHRQWVCLGHRALATLYFDLLALSAAQQHLEQSLLHANAIDSRFHIQMAAGYQIACLLAAQEFAQAKTLLKGALPTDLPMQTLVQRWLWRGCAEFALAQGDPARTLDVVDHLFAAAMDPGNDDVSAIPYLAKLRGEALTALQRWTEAEAVLQAALTGVQRQGAPRLIWRIQVAVGKLYYAQARHRQAEQAFAAARQVIAEIAANIPDVELRENFVRQANAMMPQPESSTPLQAAKQTYGGLTRREREVAALIAQGKSNRAIAEALVIGERTVEGYVSNMLNKLGFTSRAQIAAWAVEKGLHHLGVSHF
jgi:DNA-binding CsgD family transcriptional regulator